MTKKQIEVAVGALLHDIGKLLYRTGDGRNHSVSGYEFLKEIGVENEEILNSVHYHHGNLLAKADIPMDSIAYIIYVADNISAASDRRKKESGGFGFDPQVPMQSVFNILNENHKELCYKPMSLVDEKMMNIPTDNTIKFDMTYYQKLKIHMCETLKGVELMNEEYLSSLLETWEAYTSYIPSSTATGELIDISLYDHVKLTAAYASCIYQYLEEQEISDYRKTCFEGAKTFYSEKAFRVLSLDVSGIQKFIYTIHSSGALKMLRSRSFYLEIMMEHMVDEILERLNLSRANLIFSGGGRCTILIPNTKNVQNELEVMQEEWCKWFIEVFGTALYVGMDSVACSAFELENQGEGSYEKVFRELGQKISQKKNHKYTKNQLLQLNSLNRKAHTRECKVCKGIAVLEEDDICPICKRLSDFSNEIINKDFFSVFENNQGLPLPSGKSLCAQSKDELKKTMESDDEFVRTYAKKRYYTGKKMMTKLWVGDYTLKHMTTDNYAKEAKGINRIAVLRADVDNLGQAFISGFDEEKKTLSRTATLSRQLSMFFKFHINQILSDGKESILADAGPRKITIVYSGGDDLFLVGAWNDIIAAAIDIHQALGKFSAQALHISAGIGLYPAKYPLSVCAREVEKLEQCAKEYPNVDSPTKNAICLFDENNTYDWETFITYVIQEKLQLLHNFFGNQSERGMAFLYRLLELIRQRNDRINLARFAYILSRLEPTGREVSAKERENYQDFAKKMYRWACDETDSKQLITAIYIFVYLHRKEDDVDETK